VVLSAKRQIFFALKRYYHGMGSGPGRKVIRAMALVRAGMVPRAAASKVGIAFSTMYRSRLYKEWKNEKRK
jgi:hypothetical protein